MNTLTKPAKSFLGTAALLSMAVLAGTMNNHRLYSTDFMKNEDVVFVSSVDESFNRNIASFVKKRPSRKIAVFPLDFNKSHLVNGSWEIIKITDSKGEIIYDKIENPKDKKSSIEVDLEIYAKGLIRIDRDNEQIYKVSLFTENGTIALFREFAGGYEILEAKKIAEKEILSADNVQQSSLPKDKGISQVKGVVFDVADDLYLASALDVNRDKNVLNIEKVSGKASIRNGEIFLEGIVLHKGTNNETESLNVDAQIQDGGIFKFDYYAQDEQMVINGIVTNNGDSGYRVRFATGPLQGAMLNFVTSDKYDLELEKFEAQQAAREESDEVNENIENSEGTREIANEADVTDVEAVIEKRKLDKDEIAQITIKKGFNFGFDQPNRQVASIK